MKLREVFNQQLARQSLFAVVTFILSLLLSTSLFIFGSSFSDSTAESMALAIDKYINSGQSSYAYSEVLSEDETENYYNSESARILVFAYWWQFETGPNNTALRKFVPNSSYAPLVLHSAGNDFTPDVISNAVDNSYGEYFGFELFDEQLSWEEYIAPQYIFLSQTLAETIATDNGVAMLDLVGRSFASTTTSNLLYSTQTDKIVAGIIKRDSYEKYIGVYGDEFVYICSNNYYLRDYCNQRIGVVFKGNLVGNRTTLRNYLQFEEYNTSNIMFYNLNDTLLVDNGALQTNYVNCLAFYQSSSATLVMLVSAVLLVITYLAIIAFLFFIKRKDLRSRKRSSSYLFIVLMSFTCSILLLTQIRAIPFFGFLLPVATIPTFLFLSILLSLIIIILFMVFERPIWDIRIKYRKAVALASVIDDKTKIGKKIVAKMKTKVFWRQQLKNALLYGLMTFAAYLLYFSYKEVTKSSFYLMFVICAGLFLALWLDDFQQTEKTKTTFKESFVVRLFMSIISLAVVPFAIAIIYITALSKTVWISDYHFALTIFLFVVVVAWVLNLGSFLLGRLSSFFHHRFVISRDGSGSKSKKDYYEIDV